MKGILTIMLITLCSNGFAQSKAELQEENTKMHAYSQELETKIKTIEYQLLLLKKENETLRDIMRGYIYQIDSLNTQLNLLQHESENGK